MTTSRRTRGLGWPPPPRPYLYFLYLDPPYLYVPMVFMRETGPFHNGVYAPKRAYSTMVFMREPEG